MKLDVVLREDARSQISTTLRQPGKKDASPIHNDVLASGERRTGRTEPEHGAGDLLRRADAANQVLCRNRFLHVGLAFAEGCNPSEV